MHQNKIQQVLNIALTVDAYTMLYAECKLMRKDIMRKDIMRKDCKHYSLVLNAPDITPKVEMFSFTASDVLVSLHHCMSLIGFRSSFVNNV